MSRPRADHWCYKLCRRDDVRIARVCGSRRGSDMAASDQTSPGSATARQGGEEMVRVLVISPVRMFQEALVVLLEQQHNIIVVGAASPTRASRAADQLRPDIVLFDATRLSDLVYAKALADLRSGLKVVAFGVGEPEAEVVALAEAGISG